MSCPGLSEAVWVGLRGQGLRLGLRVAARFGLGRGMFPIGSSRRRLLNQSTHSRVANSTAAMLRHKPRRWMTSALNRPLIVSARALS